jgi:hypothetical protein
VSERQVGDRVFDLDHDCAQAVLCTGDERGDVNAPVGFPGRSLFGLRSSITQEVTHKPFELRPSQAPGDSRTACRRVT